MINRCNTTVTKNKVSVLSDVYIACLNNVDKIERTKIESYINSCIINTYKLSRSSYNMSNRIIADNSDYTFTDHVEETATIDIQIQNMEYLFSRYLLDAKPSDKIFFDLYVNKGIRSVRKISKKLNISHYGAYVLINEFKSKLKSYER